MSYREQFAGWDTFEKPQQEVDIIKVAVTGTPSDGEEACNAQGTRTNNNRTHRYPLSAPVDTVMDLTSIDEYSTIILYNIYLIIKVDDGRWHETIT